MTGHRAPRGIVAAGHDATAQTAKQILQAGGNAFDAILGAMCAACVVEPVLASLGGGGFLLAHTPDYRDSVFDFFVQTPRRRRREDELEFSPMEADFGTVCQRFHYGLGSVATPGVVRGLFEAHRALGSMPMRDVVGPAIALARDGVVVNAFQAYALRIVHTIFTATEECRRIYGSQNVRGEPATGGERLVLPELADTLEILAIEGSDLFYRGEIAQTIAMSSRDGGGSLELADLENYEVHRRDPLTVDYRDVRVVTNPPPASGGLLIAFGLKLLEAEPLSGSLGFGSSGHLDLIAQTLEQTDLARAEMLASGNVSHPDRAMLDGELLERYRTEVRNRARAFRGTTHMNVIDAKGNVAALTLSNGAGSGFVVPGTGVMLNNMLGEEDLLSGPFHEWPTDERMTSMMSPTMIEWPGDRITAMGSGGSKRIRRAILQLLVNLVDHGMSVEEAVEAPRIFYEGGELSVEEGFDSRELDRLFQTYRDHRPWGERNLFFGGAHTVERRGAELTGVGDPRRGGVSSIVF
jgi:gamma-glutamyltranspeptidase/glutathione hydrolase